MPEDEPIRVLRVIARLNVGGPALHVAYLTNGLDARGYETTLVAGRVGPGEGSMEYVAEEQGIHPLFLPALQRELSLGLDMAAVAQVQKLIRELRPHVLHTHTAKAGAVGRVAAALAGSARPRVVVHTFHGHVLRGYFDRGRTAAFLRAERALAHVTDMLVAVSPQVRDELVALGVAPRERFEVIRLGLDLQNRTAAAPEARDEERARLRLPPDAYVVGWLGRMTSIKRVDELLEAFSRAAAEHPSMHLVLAGDGPQRQQLEQMSAGLGVGSRISFLGMRGDVGPLYAACDVIALSSANEGTPVTLIEALAAGRPVVSTDVGGVRDVVRHGETGLLVPAGDLDALAAALLRLADPRHRLELAHEGVLDVRARYSVERLVDEVDNLYRRLLAEKQPRRGLVMRSSAKPLAPTLQVEPVRRTRRALRIILVSQYFPPEVGATQSRMQAFAEHLAAAGHRVTVICEFPNHPHGVIPAEYGGRLYEDDRSNPYRVLRVWVKAAVRKTPRSRMAFYLSYMALATAMAPVAGRADVVVATSPPLFSGAAGLALARLYRAPFVLDVRDLWPAAAVSLEQISAGMQLTAAEWLERQLYRRSAAVIGVTRPFCNHIDAIRGRPPRTNLIPNGTLDLFLEARANGGRAALGAADGEFLITFAGTHGIAQGLESVLDAAPMLAGEARFAFVGDGPIKEPLVRAAAARRLGNVTFHPQVPITDMPPLLAASDALLVPLSGHETFRDFVPSKLMDAMAVGRPIVLTASGEASRLLGLAGAGIVAAPEDSADLVRAVRWLMSNRRKADEMGERGREFARKRLRSVQAERLEELLLDVAR